MTTPDITAPIGAIEPTTADIDAAEAKLDSLSLPLAYVYVAGYLASNVQSLAYLHADCHRSHCLTCSNLRRSLAYVAALDRRESR